MAGVENLFSFQNLLVWQKSRELVKEVYSIIATFPQTECFSMADQLRRAVISVPANIAEGSAKTSDKDQIRFIEIAYGSLMETYCLLQLSEDIGLVSSDVILPLATRIQEIARMLSGLRRNKQENQTYFKH